jgi:molecular chaperone GrpE (heat shock protein)
MNKSEEKLIRNKISGLIQNKKFEEVILRILESVNGNDPQEEWFQKMSDSQRKLYWIVMEKYNLLPQDWINQLGNSFEFPKMDFDEKKIKFAKRVKAFLKKKYIFLFLFIVMKRLDKNEKKVEEFFDFFEFESEIKLNKKSKASILKYLTKFWENFKENTIKDLSLEYLIKFKTTRTQFKMLNNICRNLKERHEIFNNVKNLFLNPESEIQEYRIKEIIKMMIPFIDKVDQLISESKEDLVNLKLPESFKKCFKEYQVFESKSLILENLMLLGGYLGLSV